jgi:hypothetical protein
VWEIVEVEIRCLRALLTHECDGKCSTWGGVDGLTVTACSIGEGTVNPARNDSTDIAVLVIVNVVVLIAVLQ